MTTGKSNKASLAVAILAIIVLGGGWYNEASRRQADAKELQRRLGALEQWRSELPRRDFGAGSGQWSDDGRHEFAARVGGRLDAADAIPGSARNTPSPADVARENARAVAQLEASFTADGSDPRWATATEKMATEAIVEPLLAPFGAPKEDDVQCARTMCRMVFTFESASQADDWALYYPTTLAQSLPVSRIHQITRRDGDVEVRLYSFRDPKTKPFN